MSYILNDDWQGLERTSPEWCQNQAESIRKYIAGTHEYIDVDGIVMLLNEMADAKYSTAESYCERIMAHLLFIHISPTNDAINHWLSEIENFSYNLLPAIGVKAKRRQGNTNIRNELTENWAEIYDRAVEQTRKKARRATIFPFHTDIIPLVAPWNLQDFMSKTPEELAKMTK